MDMRLIGSYEKTLIEFGLLLNGLLSCVSTLIFSMLYDLCLIGYRSFGVELDCRESATTDSWVKINGPIISS